MIKVKDNIRSLIYRLGADKSDVSSKVIYYHDIHADGTAPYTSMSTPLSLFEKHIKIIKDSKFEIVKEITSNEGQIQITFDDGFKGVSDQWHFLEQNHIPVTVFVAIDQVDQPGSLSRQDIRSLSKLGIAIQSHTVTHRNLPDLNDNDLIIELKTSKTYLEDLLVGTVDAICYPRGLFSDRVYEFAHNVGYKKQYSSLPGSYKEQIKKGLIRRNLVQSLVPTDFKCVLFGGNRFFARRSNKMHYVQASYERK